MLPADTRVLSIGIHPRSLDWRTLPEGVDETSLSEHTELFERIVNVLHELAPGIRLCFNTAPDNTVDALRRWITPHP